MLFFLNSTARAYDDTELNKVPALLFSSGVFNTLQATQALWKISGDFTVQPAGGSLNITALPGAASVLVASDQGSTTEQQRVIIQEDSELTASVASNPSIAVRSDAVVLRVDQSVIADDELNSAGSNAVSLVVVSGNSEVDLTDSEIAVALSGDPFVRLANIALPQNATEVTAGMITDARSLVTMTRSVKMGSDRFRFYALNTDPDNLQSGDVWFNVTEGILKMYDGDNTIALQTQSFDWGYYPPNGIDQNITAFEPVVENDGSNGVGEFGIYEVINVNDSSGFSLMAGEQFVMPNVANPFIRVKMGSTPYPASVQFSVYTVSGNDPDSLVEDLPAVAAEDVPVNDYLNFYLTEAYTPGTTYMLVGRSTRVGFVNANPSDWYRSSIQYSSFEDEDEILLGSAQGSVASLTTDPTAATWGAPSSGRHFVMSISEREELHLGQTDSAGNVHLFSQGFVPKSKDITGFSVVKGEDNGSPTGDITASLYLADQNNNAIGDVLVSATIEAADWNAADAGTEVYFDIAYDLLVVGQKYVIQIDTDDYSDDDNYTVYFGVNPLGTAKFFNTNDGWTDLNGDLFYGIRTSGIRKIVVTNDQGKIAAELIPSISKTVTYIDSAAVPYYSIEGDALEISELATAITSMTSGKIGTPHDFKRFTYRIKDNGTSRAITWGADFENRGATLPANTTLGKWHTIDVEYNEATGKLGCIRAIVEA